MKDSNLHKPGTNSGYAEKPPSPLATRSEVPKGQAVPDKLESSIFRRKVSDARRSVQAEQSQETPKERDNG